MNLNSTTSIISQGRIIKKNINNCYYIAKPDAGSQGRGIYLFQNLEQLINNQSTVVQQYIEKPFLIDGLKFDFRVYVLIKSLHPLKIFVYKQGLARLATNIYEGPNKQNINNLTMHLTNYAINKRSPLFVFNNSQNQDDIGHKRSYSAVLDLLKKQGQDTDGLQSDIDQIIVKTIISAYSLLNQIYKQSRINPQVQSACFQILGFDIMIDSSFKPYLIEVNHTPSFTTDTPLDFVIKKNLILDTLNLLNINYQEKKEYLKSKDPMLHTQRLTGNQIKQLIIQEAQYENMHLGGYRKVYPTKNHMRIYNHLIKINQNINGIRKFTPKILLPVQSRNVHKFQAEEYVEPLYSEQKIFKNIVGIQIRRRQIYSQDQAISLPYCGKNQQKLNSSSQKLRESKNLRQKIRDQKIANRYMMNQKKKFQNLEPIKLKNIEIDFTKPQNFQTILKVKNPYQTANYDEPLLIESNQIKKKIKKPSMLEFEKNYFKDFKVNLETKGTPAFIQLKQSFYEHVNKFSPVRNWHYVPKLRFHKTKGKNITAGSSRRQLEGAQFDEFDRGANLSFYGKI